MTKEFNSNQKIAVFGAYGHTGKFVVAELVKRGWSPVLIGRNKECNQRKIFQFGDTNRINRQSR